MVPRPGPLPATSDTRAAFFPGHLGPGALLSGRALLNKNLPPPSTPPIPTPTSFPLTSVMSVSGVEYKFSTLERDAQPRQKPLPLSISILPDSLSTLEEQMVLLTTLPPFYSPIRNWAIHYDGEFIEEP